MKIDYFGTVQRASRKYAQFLNPICEKWDLTKNELDVLLFLGNNPEYDRAADIVAHRGMVKSHVSLSVTNLERRGLLLRTEDSADRRAVRLQLSQEGKAIAQAGREYQIRFFSGIFSGLSQEDIDFWQQLMEQVCRNIDNLDL